jgi:hypothetical protein
VEFCFPAGFASLTYGYENPNLRSVSRFPQNFVKVIHIFQAFIGLPKSAYITDIENFNKDNTTNPNASKLSQSSSAFPAHHPI